MEHNISRKIMFGSGSPRIRPVQCKRGLDSLGFSSETLENIYYKNALRFWDMHKNTGAYPLGIGGIDRWSSN